MTDNLAPNKAREEKKPDLSLLPMDILARHLTPAYFEGVIKYYKNSWRKGFPISEMVAKSLRHIEKFYWQGEDLDPDALELGVEKHHLAGAVFSLLTALWVLDTRPELDDRWKKQKETTIDSDEYKVSMSTPLPESTWSAFHGLPELVENKLLDELPFEPTTKMHPWEKPKVIKEAKKDEEGPA